MDNTSDFYLRHSGKPYRKSAPQEPATPSLRARAVAEFAADLAARDACQQARTAESEERDRQNYHASLRRVLGIDHEPASADAVVTVDGLRFAYREDRRRIGRLLHLCGDCACGAAVPLAVVGSVLALGALLAEGFPARTLRGEPPICADCRQRRYEEQEEAAEAAAAAADPMPTREAPASLTERLEGLLRELVREELRRYHEED